MAWSADLSSSDEEENAAVEELLAQVIDEHILEITTTPIGVGPLDSDLESRFQDLKRSSRNAFAGSTRNSAPPDQKSLKKDIGSPRISSASISEGHVPVVEELPPSPTPHGSSSNSGRDASSSSEGIRRNRSVSPPPSRSCFCVSPKKLLRSFSSKKAPRKEGSWRFSQEGNGSRASSRVSEGNTEILSDLSTFSLKSQRKQLRKALKDEERVSREAEELVEWVKRASARITSLEDLHIEEDDKAYRRF